jgi:hypothetical protein
VVRRGQWDLGTTSRVRWSTLLPWALGIVAYQLINPGQLGWWTALWQHVDDVLGFAPQSWMSASILSFLVAAVATLLLGGLSRRRA